MATLAEPISVDRRPTDSPIVKAIDRWIYVFMAATFVVVTLTGFIPDSLEKIAAVKAGERPPFPLVMHFHAVLMGSFLLLLLAQTVLMATGRRAPHFKLGMVAMVLAPAIVVVGFILAPTMYHMAWQAAATAPPEARDRAQQFILRLDNILLMQLRIGLLFPLFLTIGLRARKQDSELHKRMMILAVAMAMPAALDRISWLPSSFPTSPISPDLYTLAIVSPMFLWDLFRNGRILKAWWIWIGVNIPFAVLVHSLWASPWWYAAAPRLMGVA